ncbi:MAG: DsbA family oxidoreductase [Egibacteraceae bacterium]
MALLTALYLDFADPTCYRVWRWLSHLPQRHTVEIRPYSLEPGDGGAQNPWDRTTPSWSVELLALGELAREAGRATHERFVDAAFAAVHERGADLSSMEGWLAISAEAGLDLAAYNDDSERWRAEVGLWHQEAEDDLGVHAVPTLVFDRERALYVQLAREVTDAAAAGRLLDDLADLAAQPVAEVRRSG